MKCLANVTVWWGFLVLFIGFVLTHTLLPVHTMFEYTNAVILSLVCGIVVATHKETLEAIRAPVRTLSPGQTLIVGMYTASVGSVLIFSGLWLRRVFPDVDFLFNGWPFALGRWLFTGGAILVLAAMASRDNVIGRRSYAIAGALVALGVAAAAVVISWTAHP